jgi:proteasome lid subunit RPN8/RPN11
MNPKTKEDMVAHAISEYPKEACGLIIVSKGKEKYIPCKNMAKNQNDHFILDPEDYANAEDAGEVLGIFHSHPDQSSKPSEADRVSCEQSGLPWYIVSIYRDESGDVKVHDEFAFEPVGYKPPLIGRTFHHGVLDCYSIIRDWYQENKGITFNDYKRQDNWWNEGFDLYLDNLEKDGFERVFDDLKVGDIILMQIRGKKPNHAGVYVGDGLFIHHMYGRLSSKDVYGGYWQEVTVSYWRLKQ